MSNSNPDDEAALFDDEAMLSDGLSELERRGDLERMGRIAAEIEIDLQDRGPLYRYIAARRAQAIAALRQLVDVRPSDIEGITAAQASVREYLQATNFVHAGLSDGDTAEAIINEEFGNEHDGDLLQDEPSWRRKR